jgi:hypothetical protein
LPFVCLILLLNLINARALFLASSEKRRKKTSILRCHGLEYRFFCLDSEQAGELNERWGDSVTNAAKNIIGLVTDESQFFGLSVKTPVFKDKRLS